MSVEPLQRWKSLANVNIPIIFTFLEMIRAFYFISSPIIPFALNVLPLYTDADKQPADNLMKVVALDINNLLTRMPDISKGVFFNVQQAPLKEWGADSLGVLQEDTMQELLTGVISDFSIFHYPSQFFSVGSYLLYYPNHFHTISFSFTSRV